MVVHTIPRNVCTAQSYTLSYVVAGSKTGDVDRDWLSHKQGGPNLFWRQFHPCPARKLSTNLYDIYHWLMYSE